VNTVVSVKRKGEPSLLQDRKGEKGPETIPPQGGKGERKYRQGRVQRERTAGFPQERGGKKRVGTANVANKRGGALVRFRLERLRNGKKEKSLEKYRGGGGYMQEKKGRKKKKGEEGGNKPWERKRRQGCNQAEGEKKRIALFLKNWGERKNLKRGREEGGSYHSTGRSGLHDSVSRGGGGGKRQPLAYCKGPQPPLITKGLWLMAKGWGEAENRSVEEGEGEKIKRFQPA